MALRSVVSGIFTAPGEIGRVRRERAGHGNYDIRGDEDDILRIISE